MLFGLGWFGSLRIGLVLVVLVLGGLVRFGLDLLLLTWFGMVWFGSVSGWLGLGSLFWVVLV